MKAAVHRPQNPMKGDRIVIAGGDTVKMGKILGLNVVACAHVRIDGFQSGLAEPNIPGSFLMHVHGNMDGDDGASVGIAVMFFLTSGDGIVW